MTVFTKDEQWDNDYDLFVIDNKGKIGRLCHFGERLLPPTIAKSRENLEKVEDHFVNLPDLKSGFIKCPDLLTHLDMANVGDFARYVYYFGEVSSRGLYTYDSYGPSYHKGRYFRVTIPKTELSINDLPVEIKNILEELRLDSICFAEDSLIPEDVVRNL